MRIRELRCSHTHCIELDDEPDKVAKPDALRCMFYAKRLPKWTPSREKKSVFGVSDQVRLKVQPAQLQRLARILKFGNYILNFSLDFRPAGFFFIL